MIVASSRPEHGGALGFRGGREPGVVIRYFARPETRLIEAAMMTAPSGKDSHA